MPHREFRFDKSMPPVSQPKPATAEQLQAEMAPRYSDVPMRKAAEPRPRMDQQDVAERKTMSMLPTLSVHAWDVNPNDHVPPLQQ